MSNEIGGEKPKISTGNAQVITTHIRIPQSMEALQNELQHHPALKEQLAAPDAVKSFEDGLAIIATYCDVILDGVYQANEIAHLCQTLINKLQAKRGSIIVIG